MKDKMFTILGNNLVKMDDNYEYEIICEMNLNNIKKLIDDGWVFCW